MPTIEEVRALGAVELVAAPPVADLHRRVSRRRRRQRAGLAVGCALAVVGMSLLVRPGGERATRLATATDIGREDVPMGVSLASVDDVAVFLVRDDQRLVAFVAAGTHLDGEPVWWCPAEQVFTSPTHGETWSIDGRAVGGPPPRGLDRLIVRDTGGGWTVDSDLVMPGPPATGPTGTSPLEQGGCLNPLKGSVPTRPLPKSFPIDDSTNGALFSRRDCADVVTSADSNGEPAVHLHGCGGGTFTIVDHGGTPSVWVALLRVPDGTEAISLEGTGSVSSTVDESNRWAIAAGPGALPRSLIAVDGAGRTVARTP